ERGGNGTGKSLIEVMVGVDQSRQHHMRPGIECFYVRCDGAASRGNQLDDAAALQHEATVGGVRKDREGILDPQCRRVTHSRTLHRLRGPPNKPRRRVVKINAQAVSLSPRPIAAYFLRSNEML